MVEEFVDEIDRQGKVIATHPRTYLKERMFLHKVSLIIPMAGDGRYLLCKRAKNKYPFPNTWCCAVGGKVSSGETEEQTAKREMLEEIGKAYPVRRVAAFIYDKSDYKGIFTIFTTMVPIPQSELKLDPEEIQYVKAFTISEVMTMLKEAPETFSPTFIDAIKEFSRHVSSSK